MTTCTQEGVTKSQPHVSVSTTGPICRDGNLISRVRLNVARHYPNLRNEFGGLGRIKRLDFDGMEFDTHEQATAFAKEHGYIREWFKKSSRFFGQY